MTELGSNLTNPKSKVASAPDFGLSTFDFEL